MSQGDAIFRDWLAKVQPRIQHIRHAYLAAGVLEELTKDAKTIVDDWTTKSEHPNPDLANQAKQKLQAVTDVYQSYVTALDTVGVQMGTIAKELDKLQDERLTLAAMCQSVNIQKLSVEVLERAYGAIGPDTAIDTALGAARSAISDLDAETKAREELRTFLADTN